MKKYIVSILITMMIGLPLLLDGCTPSGETERDKVEILPAERLVKKLEANRRKIKSFEGIGTLDIRTPDFDNAASFRVVLKKPDSINVEIYGPFGIELGQALVTENDFRFYDVFNNTEYYGEMSDDVLSTIFRVDISFPKLMDAFVGAVNLTDILYVQPTSYRVDNNQYVLSYVDSLSGNTSIYHVNILNLGVAQYAMQDANGNTILEAFFDDFHILEDVAVPYEVELYYYLEDHHIDIEYEKARANSDKIVIEFEVPKDATLIEW